MMWAVAWAASCHDVGGRVGDIMDAHVGDRDASSDRPQVCRGSTTRRTIDHTEVQAYGTQILADGHF